MIADIFRMFLAFFAEHWFLGLLVGYGLLLVGNGLANLAAIAIRQAVILFRGHPPAAQGRTVIKCENVTTSTK